MVTPSSAPGEIAPLKLIGCPTVMSDSKAFGEFSKVALEIPWDQKLKKRLAKLVSDLAAG